MLLAQINETTKVDAKVGDETIRTDVARAKSLYKSVVDMDLKNLDAHSALARTLVATDEFEGAIQENWILEELSPAGKWQYIMNVGDLWALSGTHEKALANWNTVSEQATTEPNLVYQLGCRMFQLGRIDDAIAWVRKAAVANKNEFRFHTTLGNLLDLSAESGDADGAREEAVSEFKMAVELAGQNPALTSQLQSVLHRLLEVEIRLARHHFSTREFAACAQTSMDALLAVEKLQDSGTLGDVLADIKVLRARAMLASGAGKEGEALLRQTLAAHSSALYWYDEKLKITGKEVLALYEAGKMFQRNSEIAIKQVPGIKLTSCSVLSLPARIDSLQSSSNGPIYLQSASQILQVTADPPAMHTFKFEGSGAPVARLGTETAAIVDSSSFRLIDLTRGEMAWKMKIVPTALFANESFVACFYTRENNQADARKEPARFPTNFLQLMNKQNGTLLWECETAVGDLVFNGRLLIVRSAENLTAISLDSGKPVWKTPLARGALWRRPIVTGGTILLVDDMTSEIVAYDLNTGELKFHRALSAAVLCDPVIGGETRVIFHFLRKGVVTLECLDMSTGMLAWESSLRAADPSPAGRAESLNGISMPPIVWNGWLLHFDVPNRRVWQIRLDTGDYAPPVALPAECDPKKLDGLMGWGVTGDTLYLAARGGQMVFIKLAK